jgi:hypothetical protein
VNHYDRWAETPAAQTSDMGVWGYFLHPNSQSCLLPRALTLMERRSIRPLWGISAAYSICF